MYDEPTITITAGNRKEVYQCSGLVYKCLKYRHQV
jgi:hypothetical protein